VGPLSSELKRLIRLTEVFGVPAYLGPFDAADWQSKAQTRAIEVVRSRSESLYMALDHIDQSYTLISRPLGKTDPLTDAFIWQLIIHWTKRTGKRPSKSKSGPFVRYVAAAWNDVRFPIPLDAEGQERALELWLGSRVDAHMRKLKQ